MSIVTAENGTGLYGGAVREIREHELSDWHMMRELGQLGLYTAGERVKIYVAQGDKDHRIQAAAVHNGYAAGGQHERLDLRVRPDWGPDGWVNDEGSEVVFDAMNAVYHSMRKWLHGRVDVVRVLTSGVHGAVSHNGIYYPNPFDLGEPLAPKVPELAHDLQQNFFTYAADGSKTMDQSTAAVFVASRVRRAA